MLGAECLAALTNSSKYRISYRDSRMHTLRSDQLVPPDGWWIVERGIRIEGHSRDNLVELLTKHRQSNGFDLGDPRADVENQICLRWPDGCSFAWSQAASKAGATFADLLSGKYALVSQEEADRRSMICVFCSENVSARDARVGCVSCGGKVKDIILNSLTEAGLGATKAAILQNRKCQQYENLKTCKQCGCDTELLCWTPGEAIRFSVGEKDHLPGHCWKKAL